MFSVLLTTPPRCSWTKIRSDNLIQTLPCSVPGSCRTSSLCGPNDPSTNQLSSSCRLLYRSLQRWSQRAELSWAVCHHSRSIMGKLQVMWLVCKHLDHPWRRYSSSCLLLSTGSPAVGGSVTDWHGGDISDDLPNQQGTPPPLGLLCLPIIRAESLPVG